MNKSWFYPIAIGSLAILATSCGDSKPAATPSATPSPASPAATAPTTVPAATAPVVAPTTLTATVPATSIPAPGAPTVPGKKSVSVDVAAGLIAPTDGDSWAKTVSKGRPDPFATLSLQPVPAPDKLDEFGQVIGKPGSASIAGNSPTIKSGVNKSLPTIKVASNSQTTKVSGKRIASRSAITEYGSIAGKSYVPISSIPRTGINRSLPKITVAIKPNNAAKSPVGGKIASNNKASNNNVLRPTNIGASPSNTSNGTTIAARTERVAEKPLQAIAVEISGVIEVDGRTQVIVKLPNESFSRYVDVGDRVANGTVLVKRVEGQQSLAPTVVLEEVGVEVPRRVGDKATTSNAAPQANPK